MRRIQVAMSERAIRYGGAQTACQARISIHSCRAGVSSGRLRIQIGEHAVRHCLSRFSQFLQFECVRGEAMLKWAAIFFGIAIVAAIFGFSGIAAGAAEIARILFFVFVAIFLVTLIMGMKRK